MASETYSMRKAQKVCTTCGKQDERTLAGRAQCARCFEAQKKYQNKRYKTNRAEKRCAKCGTSDERTLAGMTLCEICAKICYINQKSFINRRRENHLCVICGATLPNGEHARCESCRERARDKRKERT